MSSGTGRARKNRKGSSAEGRLIFANETGGKRETVVGVEVKVAANSDALVGLMESAPKLVIVDLNARSQPLEAIEKLRRGTLDVV